MAIEPEVTLINDLSEKGQSQAALSGLARASALGYDSALLIPGDTPLIDPLEIDSLVSNTALADVDVVIVPDRHGTGTNALVMDPGGTFQPQFGPDSLQRHVEQAKRRSIAARGRSRSSHWRWTSTPVRTSPSCDGPSKPITGAGPAPRAC